MRQPQSRFRYASYLRPSPPPPSPWTRKEFYRISEECLEFANQLALFDQHRVYLKQCHEFNDWLLVLKSYEGFGTIINDLTSARPIARWQVMMIGAVIGAIAFLVLPSALGQPWSTIVLYTYALGLLLLYFLPQRLYGTTIEMLEGKVLRVVETMEIMLLSEQMEFTEAAYFQVKERLSTAKRELRQQIDLAHR